MGCVCEQSWTGAVESDSAWCLGHLEPVSLRLLVGVGRVQGRESGYV